MSMRASEQRQRHRVVIVGGGFGGLYAAQTLRRAPVQVTLIDRHNYHLFQPLLYQVATGGLSPGDIASPLRAILNRAANIQVIQAEVVDIDPAQERVILRDGEAAYDTLIVAAGFGHFYFGHDDWAAVAPGLKSVEDALEMRRRILLAFEAAEREPDLDKRRAWLTFVIVGGGPTGVELAGALGELAHGTLQHDFRTFDPREATILLLENSDRILTTYPPALSQRATEALTSLGVTVQTGSLVTAITTDAVTVQRLDATTVIPTKTVLWAAGMRASGLGAAIAHRTGAALDRAGRVVVQPDLTVPNYPDIFVIGDLAHFPQADGQPLPGVAPVAIQQGAYAGKLIRARLQGKTLPPFRYRDKGSLAVVGRNAGVADFGRVRMAGFPAWLAWLFIHIWYLIGFENKLLVLIQWAWNYWTRKRGARLITGMTPVLRPVEAETITASRS
jgi:NADH dehydrogenase